jgi:hypothetical protein
LLRSIAFNFSHVFEGVIWNIKISDERDFILVEIRNHLQRTVKFSALNYKLNTFLWKEKELEEPWWINLSGVSGDFALFTLYTDTHNPDKKAALAYDIVQEKLAWWNNDFSISAVMHDCVLGTTDKFGKHELMLDARTGERREAPASDVRKEKKAHRPNHYPEGHPYFNTVKEFLNRKFNLLPTAALEYLEYDSLIFISCYLHGNELANYLFVFSPDGTLLLKELLGEHLKGIGLDTFFILSGCLFFVRNKGELVSYKIL